MESLTISRAIEAVRALARQPVETPRELEAWYEQSHQLKQQILNSNLWGGMPHFIQHYLDDADIRIKDPEYRSAQDHELEAALSTWGKRAV